MCFFKFRSIFGNKLFFDPILQGEGKKMSALPLYHPYHKNLTSVASYLGSHGTCCIINNIYNTPLTDNHGRSHFASLKKTYDVHLIHTYHPSIPLKIDTPSIEMTNKTMVCGCVPIRVRRPLDVCAHDDDTSYETRSIPSCRLRRRWHFNSIHATQTNPKYTP